MSEVSVKRYKHTFIVKAEIESDEKFDEILTPKKLEDMQVTGIELIKTRHNDMCMCFECMGK